MSRATDKYSHLTNGQKADIDLTQAEACAVLYAYDYGIDSLGDVDRHELVRVIAKLKDQIWP